MYVGLFNFSNEWIFFDFFFTIFLFEIWLLYINYKLIRIYNNKKKLIFPCNFLCFLILKIYKFFNLKKNPWKYYISKKLLKNLRENINMC